jgi:hypothetical protein
MEIKQLLDNIKGMDYFTVTIQLNAPLQFNGVVPFDMSINKDHLAKFKVLASNKDDAMTKVMEYLLSLKEDD